VALLPWAAAGLALAWTWLWLARGRRGIAVHALLALAFLAMVLWGAFRARQSGRSG
jgi:hypothetical protein